MRVSLKRFLPVAAALLVLCAFAAVAQAKGTTVTWSYTQEPPNWDYQKTGLTAVTAPLLLNVWETLIQLEADGKAVGLLAEKWTVSSDLLTITFTLRRGVKFHDGSDFTSASAVYSMKSNAAGSVDKCSLPYKNVKDIKALDKYTVQVTLSKPDLQFVNNMSNRAGIMVPDGFFEANDAATKVIGTGPYMLTQYRRDQDLTMTRFEKYWGKKPFFKTAIQRFIPDETAAINALLAGQTDFVGSVISEGMDRVFSVTKANPKIKLVLIPGTEVSYWLLNPKTAVFKDIRVRQAIMYGLDRKAHVDAATAGTATPSASMAVPSGVAWDSTYDPCPFNPAKAVELLKAAGYGPGQLVLDFPYANVAWHPAHAQVFQAEMEKIGITVKLRSLDLASWLDQVNKQGQYEVFQITDGAPLINFGYGRGRQPFIAGGFRDEGMEKLINKVEAQTNWDAYIAAQRELHKYVAEQGWIFSSDKPNVPVLYRADLAGIKKHRLPDIHIYAGDLRWAD
jgi:peptide/nickel transport system substrate-binding protein